MPITGLMQVVCTRSDGAQVTGTLNFTPATGALTSGQVINTSAQPVALLITDSGAVVRQVSAPAGTTNYTPAQLSAAGFTNISQVHGFSVTCV